MSSSSVATNSSTGGGGGGGASHYYDDWSTCWNGTRNYTCPDCNLVPQNTSNCTYFPLKVPETGKTTPLCNISSLNFTGLPYVKYNFATVCIVVGGVTKMLFHPTVDDFTALTASPRPPPTNERYRFDSPDNWLQVEVGNVVSSAKRRRNKNGPAIVPFWTAIIYISNGIPTSVLWDEGCYGCDDTNCIDNICAVPINTCWKDNVECPIKIYLGWYGTDANGAFMTSSGKRLSRFRAYSINSAFNSAALRASEIVPDPPEFSGVELGGQQ